MKVSTTSLVVMFAICLMSLSAEKVFGVAHSAQGAQSGFRGQALVPTAAGEGRPNRLIDDLSITEEGSVITLSWTAVPEALYYIVYSSDLPDLGFAEDTSGSFAGETWTAPVSGSHCFYYVTYISSEAPAGFVYVPGGTFTMGRTTGSGDSDELPTHSVTLSPFYIGICEVTQAEYAAIMGSNPAHDYGVGDNYPVYFISWYSILKYCNLRSLAEGLTPVYSISGSSNPVDWGDVPTDNNTAWDSVICDWNANGYRLPTEAEWEYAARGATNDPDYLYSGSDNINAVAWYYGNNYHDGSKPVGTKAPNGIDNYDMCGNVAEWCWDWWGNYNSAPQTDPTGPGSGSYRVLRGGSWNNSPYGCRLAGRFAYYPYSGNHYSAGFRLCRAMN